MRFALIFHIGAGYQSLAKEKEYLNLCSTVVDKFKFLTRNDISLYDLASFIIDSIENSHLTNSGYGSNLTQNGNIECESAAMESSSLRFAALGCLKHVKNPGTVAIRFLQAQIERPVSSIGRIFPAFLVGPGAEEFIAKDLEMELVEERDLIHQSAYNYWKKYSLLLAEDKEEEYIPSFKRQRNDTIGLVLLSDDGKIITVSSSGGIALKREGRIGHSCIYGAGLWAEKNIGIVSSGTGEQIVRTCLAKKMGQNLINSLNSSETLEKTMKDDFLYSEFLQNETNRKYVGVVGLNFNKSEDILELFCAHTTQSMGYGYCFVNSRGKYSSEVKISRKSKEKETAISVFATKF